MVTNLEQLLPLLEEVLDDYDLYTQRDALGTLLDQVNEIIKADTEEVLGH